ncbi:MAG: hypothetical protein LWY06_19020 [Firmicutes bacterium]|nr:hypothetical protein [Bacillota bacterium]
MVGVTGAIFFRPQAEVRYVRFPVDNGKTCIGAVYKPTGIIPGKKYPAVFLIPGIYTPHTAMENIAFELTRRNYFVFSIYVPDWNPSGNLKVLKKGREYFFKNFPEADSSKTAYLGHSLGGTTAVDATYKNKNAWAASAIGFYIGGELKAQPPNLLLGTGIYDEQNGPEKMKLSIGSVTYGKLNGEGRIGDFRKKNVRELFFSPYSGHASELSDPFIARKLAEFLSLSFFGVTEKNKFISFPFYKISIMMLLLGGFLTAVPLMMLFLEKYEYHYRFIYLLLIPAAGIMLVFVPINPVAVVRIFGILFLAFLFSNYYMKKYENQFLQAYKGFLVFFVRVAAVGVLFVFSFIFTQLLFSLKLLFSSGKLFSAFPAYLVVTFPLCACTFMVSFILLIKQAASWIWIFPILLCGFLYFLETISPGWTIRTVFRNGEEIRRFFKFRKSKTVTPKSIAVLVVCIAAAVFAWVWLIKSGMANPQIMTDYVLFILRYLLIPLSLTLFIRYKIKTAKTKKVRKLIA